MKLSACLFVSLFVWATCNAQTLSIVRFQGGDPPVVRGDGTLPPGFVGYFSPKANEQFDAVQPDGTTQTETTLSDRGCRFGESRGEDADPHNGVDLIGWVEKVDKGGNPEGFKIHLFDTTWVVKNRVAGKVGSVNTDTGRDGLSIIHRPDHPIDYKEEYEHIAVPTTYSMGGDVAAGATLGPFTRLNLASNEWIHLHYACTDDLGKYVNPFGQAGARGLYEFTVPEPAMLAMMLPFSLLARRRRAL